MKILFLMALSALLTACSAHNNQPQQIGMANLASVYCEKIGGKLDIVKEPGGEASYCILPSGERIEEWVLYRRDHK